MVSGAARRDSCRRAFEALERAYHRTKRDLEELRRRHEDLVRSLGTAGVAPRLAASAPDLSHRVGEEATRGDADDRLRRNVAWHSRATGLDILAANRQQLRAAARGPRLGMRPRKSMAQQIMTILRGGEVAGVMAPLQRHLSCSMFPQQAAIVRHRDLEAFREQLYAAPLQQGGSMGVPAARPSA